MKITNQFLVIAAIVGMVSMPLAGAESQDLSLEGILKATLENNGEIKEADADISIARAQKQRAHAAGYPKAEALLLLAPMFEETGNALRSESNWGKWGPFVKGGLSIVQPLHTFGQIDGYKKAADHQILARSELKKMKTSEILLKAKEFYYGYYMAEAFVKLLNDLVSFLEEAVVEAEKSKEEKDSTVKPHDLFHLKTELHALKQKQLLAKQSRKTARRAVAWISGLDFKRLPRRKFEPTPVELKPLETYLAMADKHRPEIRALKEGQKARLALSSAKKAQHYPVLFAGAFFSQGWAPTVDKQPSMFANDPFNGTQGGVGIGLKFDLEFKRHSAEAAEEHAEYMKLKAKESYALPGIQLQVKKAFWELEEAIAGLKLATERAALSKKWFVSSAMGWSIGLTKPKDLMESLKGDGEAKRNYIETVYAHKMAVARLKQAVGLNK